MSWSTALTELNDSIADYFGEVVQYLSLDGLTAVADISAVVDRGEEDGHATIDIPVADVASPVFGGRITDSDSDVWRIFEMMQTDAEITTCELRRSEFWHTMTAEYYRDDTEVWATHTSGLTVNLTQTGASEIIDAEDGRAVNSFQLRTQYLTSITGRMRFKWGTRYLYVVGVQPEDTMTRWTGFDCTEEEA